MMMMKNKYVRSKRLEIIIDKWTRYNKISDFPNQKTNTYDIFE